MTQLLVSWFIGLTVCAGFSLIGYGFWHCLQKGPGRNPLAEEAGCRARASRRREAREEDPPLLCRGLSRSRRL